MNAIAFLICVDLRHLRTLLLARLSACLLALPSPDFSVTSVIAVVRHVFTYAETSAVSNAVQRAQANLLDLPLA
jgi:hypothetical protein